MSERYAKLFALPEKLYAQGAPVLIAAGALLRNNQSGKMLAQLKMQSITGNVIKTATIQLTPLDTTGKPLGGQVTHRYLDLTVTRDAYFGQNVPLLLPDTATRSFTAMVTEVIFLDNTIWTANDTLWQPLSPPKPLSQATGGNNELFKQFRIVYGAHCQWQYHTERGLWQCACGALNWQDEPACHRCQQRAADLAALDWDALIALRDKRLEQAQQDATARQAETAQRKSNRTKKIKKWTKFILPLVLAVVLICTLIFMFINGKANRAYQDALVLMESESYGEAISAFAALGDHKDSLDLLDQCLLYVMESVLAQLDLEQKFLDNRWDFSYDKEHNTLIVSYNLCMEEHISFEELNATGEHSINKILNDSVFSMGQRIGKALQEDSIDISFRLDYYLNNRSTVPVVSYTG